MELLDSQAESVSWDEFYELRNHSANFIIQKPPHRRLTYIELLKSVLKPGGYFGLVCFAWGENCADEVDDWEFYQQRKRVGVAFSKERLTQLFEPHFEIIEIRKYRNGVPDTIQGLDFM